MTNTSSDRLYNLLPAILRSRDAERGEPLRALLDIIESQFRLVEDDIAGLYDDWFIETCDEWVVPYIGDLLGVRHLHAVEEGSVLSHRAFVANTLRYRKRKGTLHMLEGLAADVTGWGAHAVPFFDLLGWTQHLNHLRYTPTANPSPRPPALADLTADEAAAGRLNPAAVDRVGTINLRSLDVVDRIGGPFDTATHTVDIRPIGMHTGWHNIRKIGFFLWRLQSYPMKEVAPRVRDSLIHPNHFHISPIGIAFPLFNNPDRKETDVGLATEVNVPGPIRPIAFFQAPNDYYGMEPDKSVAVYRGPRIDLESLIPASQILCKDLSDWSEPPEGVVALDVRLGRLVFHPNDIPDEVTVTYHHGFGGDVGGGPYDRRTTIVTPTAAEAPAGDGEVVGKADWSAEVSKIGTASPPDGPYRSIREAIDAWRDRDVDEWTVRAVITVLDNGAYDEEITLNAEGSEHLIIQSDNEQRPLVRFVNAGGDLDLLRAEGSAGRDASLTLSGLLMEGGIFVNVDGLGKLELLHCTLVPGRALDEDGQPLEPDAPSIIVAEKTPESPPSDASPPEVLGEGATEVEVNIASSIVGRLVMPENMICLTVRDSIIDASSPDTPARRSLALVSGDLSSFPAVSAVAPSLTIRIGAEAAREIHLPWPPSSLPDAAALLEQAIRRSARGRRAYARTRVVARDSRLIILPGVAGRVHVTGGAFDETTAAELLLDEASAEIRQAVVSGALDPFPLMSSSTPRLSVTVGAEGPHEAVLAAAPTDLLDARDRLQEAIRAAHPTSDSFIGALVLAVDDRLVVLPGKTNTGISFAASSADTSTITELALKRARPALTQGLNGDPAGPPAVLERTTIFGETFVKTLSLASEVIFSDRVTALQRQAGCVRYSYVEGLESVTPRRFRCQPELALEQEARQQHTTVAALPAVAKSRIRARLRPIFTSRRFGDPAYAQLSFDTDEGIKTGAENEAEMGVFNHLMQPQREANLRLRLEEFLPYGLDAGIIYVT